MGIYAIAVIAVVVGATLQRLSGTGVGLVVAPCLALAMGPQLGVFVANSTTVCSGFLIMFAVLKDVDWKRWGLFASVGVVGALPGALLVRELSAGWLNVVIGSVVLVALVLTFTMPRVPHVTGRGLPVLTAAAGAVGGFLNTASGVAAPAMVMYGQFARWPQRNFAATMQPTFMMFGLTSVLAKLFTGATTVDQLPPVGLFGAIIVAVIAGIRLGGLLSRRVSPDLARRIAIALAGAGALSALVRGLIALVG
ncbi:sulfite exporter TauE/SafE family protein [Brevibacterium yomogidense]|uniref:sulfite exporter TauE/SafE family protein n=1 Tax=Brevibacterium yomogidense TaxID=946573 RepID=UPI0018DFC20C|nr:sulfite exporter TauE/SafE family protein [Brevibacterium yomogidense]